MSEHSDLKQKIKEVLIQELMLQEGPEEIADDTPLFGEGLGLDSVDALQLVVALEKNFGLKVDDAEQAKLILRSVDTIADAIVKM
ncbi:MAG: phosphopantetheine-binding protein [Verrucomicrobiales bacterium]|nr:phosphopantetheine-binding protein [Verrucomicrobiales bacterium]